MSKSAKEEIQKDEQMVLYELMKDSSRTINNIAKKLGFSRQKVLRVIKKLEKNNTIWGFTAVVNSEKIGMKNYFLMGKRSTKPVNDNVLDIVIKGKFEEITQKSNSILDGTYYMNGEYDFIVQFRAKDLKNAKQFYEEFIRTYQGFICKTTLAEVVFPVRVNGILNPDIKNLHELF